jgi:parvulin-like peptidyl-prolyl isomerase
VAAFERETARCQAALDTAGYDVTGCGQDALQSLIEHEVIEQAALGVGLSVDQAEVDAAWAEVEAIRGGPEGLAAWLEANLYTPEEFREALRDERLRALAGQRAAAAVGPTAEQVHARVIVVTSEETARMLLDQLQAGSDFATIAVNYSRDLASRAAGGDLGWFPRGILSVPEVEAAAFSLAPGELSPVVSSAMGFHIVQTLAYDPARPLDPAAAQTLRAAAWQAWLDRLLAEADIVTYVDP